ncbi:MAG: DUF2306 domain-containing protein [Flavobacteriales bacterium]|nr:DUF2306 domain-containing protein [Flavobacteriales bacterium]
MNSGTLRLLRTISLMTVYGYCLYLMVAITLQYIPIKTDVAFLAIKQDYVHMTHYRIAFFIHVFVSILALLAGFTQFSKGLRRKYPALHRKAGWLYAGVIILLAGPSGLVIGIYANGGWPSRLAFCMLAVLWVVFTLFAIITARKRDMVAHRRWMIRSFALTLSAITLRAWKYFIVAAFHPRPMDVYQVVAWLGWVLNLIVAEIIILKTKSS